MVGAVVGHTSDHQTCAVVSQHGMLIEQYLQSQTLEFGRPRALTGVVLVIARYEERPVASTQLSQWSGMRREVPHGTIDQIACDGNDVRPKGIHCVHDSLDVLPLDR